MHPRAPSGATEGAPRARCGGDARRPRPRTPIFPGSSDEKSRTPARPVHPVRRAAIRRWVIQVSSGGVAPPRLRAGRACASIRRTPRGVPCRRALVRPRSILGLLLPSDVLARAAPAGVGPGRGVPPAHRAGLADPPGSAGVRQRRCDEPRIRDTGSPCSEAGGAGLARRASPRCGGADRRPSRSSASRRTSRVFMPDTATLAETR